MVQRRLSINGTAMAIRTRYVSSILLSALLLAGGTGVMTPIAASAGIISPVPLTNSCVFLSAKDIKDVTHMAVDPGRRHDSGRLTGGIFKGAYSSSCVWKASVDRNAHDPSLPLGGASFAILAVIVWPPKTNGPADFLKAFRDAAHQRIIATAPVALHIGDEALWWGDGVAARRGRFAFGISVHLVQTRAEQQKMEEILAKYVVAKM